MIENPEKPNQDIAALHPIMWDRVQDAIASLKAISDKEPWFPEFRLFEGYRSPERQAILLKQGRSKALPWQSAHQYGLAVDLVPFVFGKWTWSMGDDVWQRLAYEILPHGLRCPISWDKCHCQYDDFDAIRRAWK